MKAPDATAITAAAEDFHKALAEGKPDQVMAMLQPDALIVEGGTVQTRDEYQSEHLGADIAYAKAVPGKQLTAVVGQDGMSPGSQALSKSPANSRTNRSIAWRPRRWS